MEHEGITDMVDAFLKSLDAGLLEYKEELKKYAVTSEATLKFLRPREVKGMNIPDVYKRMLIAEIIHLQNSPETKQRVSNEAQSPLCQRVEGQKSNRENSDKSEKCKLSLFPDSNSRNEDPATKVSTGSGGAHSEGEDFITREKSRLSEEVFCLQAKLSGKKEELQNLKTTPARQPAVAIPGQAVMRVVCDKCHIQGHRQCGNKGNISCPYERCEGYHFCGHINKHPEHKQQLANVTKDIQRLEKKIRTVEEECNNLKRFEAHNKTSFVGSVKGKLVKSDAKYQAGKSGKQSLLRDLRYIQVACKDKIPPDLDNVDWNLLVAKGKQIVRGASMCI